MTYKNYAACVQQATAYTDKAAYIAALSSAGDTDARRECLGQLWDACHRDIKEIAAAAGMSARKLAERFCIPYRTMENWCGGVNESPAYLRLMMQECLGLLDIQGLTR